MPSLASLSKRLFVGRPLESDRLAETLIPKRIALPIFASDALSSVAYAPEEILLTLSLAGLSAYHLGIFIGIAVGIVMLTVVASYRQTVHAYPSGGGDYEVASHNLGRQAGLTVASALLVDYVLTVAVSISSGVANFTSAVPALQGHQVTICIAVIVLLTAMNLRGVRESGTVFAIPTYGFMIAIIGMMVWGGTRMILGSELTAESAHFTVHAEGSYTGLALAFLILRSFSSGSAALTGVEAISNGVPAFRKPKSKNAATTLLMMGLVAVTMLMGILWLSHATGVRIAESNADLGGAPAGYEQKTVIAQIAQAVFSNFPVAFYFVATVTAVILVLAANTAFNGFPVLGSILARDSFLPRQLGNRGDRLAFSNGILALAAFAIVLIVAFDAQVTRLIQLYIVGVFVSFNLSQLGMIRHWTRLLHRERDRRVRRRMQRSRAINSFGLVLTAIVLVVVLITKFLVGAWIAIVAMVVIFAIMRGIRRHYDRIAVELAPTGEDMIRPARVHAIVLVSKVHKPTLRAVAYAQATRPSTIEGLTVAVDQNEARRLLDEWERFRVPIALHVLNSPYREITKPIVQYVKTMRKRSPRDVVTVFIPEYVVGHVWEQLLHNQSALWLKGRLLFTPGVMVTSVPWQLHSSERLRGRRERPAPGDLRRLVRVTDEWTESGAEARDWPGEAS